MRSVEAACPSIADALRVFGQTDWTFRKEKTNGRVHGLHPYPAKFIPQVPGTLLNIFHPVVGGPVLDPFCGCGTTLVEAQVRGIPSWGIDLNPIATLISRVKTSPPTTPLVPLASEIVRRAAEKRVEVPGIPRLEHWFSNEASTALAALVDAFHEEWDQRTSDAMKLVLSRIIVRISRQESDTRYAAVMNETSREQVFSAFIDSAGYLDSVFAANPPAKEGVEVPAVVLTRDITTVPPDEIAQGFGMVITSPPYPNAYEYWLYHKYRMYWLGEDPLSVRKREIGARPHYFRSNPATEVDFERQMSGCFSLFANVCKPDALVCFLVGRSIIHGRTIDNAALLERAAAPAGYEMLAVAEREIPNTRKAFNPANSQIQNEKLVVFRKGIA